jgi:hypothetical protein
MAGSKLRRVEYQAQREQFDCHNCKWEADTINVLDFCALQNISKCKSFRFIDKVRQSTATSAQIFAISGVLETIRGCQRVCARREANEIGSRAKAWGMLNGEF